MFTPVRISKAQWQPAIRSPRPFIGQAQFPATLSIMVAKDAAPAAGVAVEVMYQDGESDGGMTGADGKFMSSYASGQVGKAVVRITAPEGVMDLGEGNVKDVDLTGAPASVSFALVSEVPKKSPLLGVAIALGLLGWGAFGT